MVTQVQPQWREDGKTIITRATVAVEDIIAGSYSESTFAASGPCKAIKELDPISLILKPSGKRFCKCATSLSLHAAFITRKKYILALLNALFWAILHSLMAPAWGLGVLWPFFIFSCAYLAWRQKSWWRAVWVVACIHAFQNALPGLAVFFQ